MKLFAISDLHLDYEQNRHALTAMGRHPTDWLIVAGDVGHSTQHFQFAFETLCPRFAQVIWVPGNHDLWTAGTTGSGLRGEERYLELVALCREHRVLTPEDAYPLWPGAGPKRLIAPLFLLYDYTFRPDSVADDRALAWAEESGIMCADEYYLHPDPYPSRSDWCAKRCDLSERRIRRSLLEHADASLILVNHWPLHQSLAVLPRVPRFTIWCGTRRTNTWHTDFPVETVIYGHLHIRRSTSIAGVRFEEVSLGYPRNWDQHRGVDGYLREIIP